MRQKMRNRECAVIENGLYAEINTRELLMRVLDAIGCQSVVVDDDLSIRFAYKGETFYVDAYLNGRTITIYDYWWEECSIYDIEAITMVKKAINEVNCATMVSTFYTIDGELDTFGISSRRTILFIPQIPEIEKYLRSALDSFFEAHRELLMDVKEQKRMKRK